MQWHDVEAWAKFLLESARKNIEGDLDPAQTAYLRGRIATLKELIALPENRKVLATQSRNALPE